MNSLVIGMAVGLVIFLIAYSVGYANGQLSIMLKLIKNKLGDDANSEFWKDKKDIEKWITARVKQRS